jgi:dipeptidyl aminopeptidase/acylaminoacyl peptidase
MIRLLLPLIALTLTAAPLKHSITHEDVWLMKHTGSLTVSPNGQWAVVSVSEPSYDPAKAVSDLWIVPTDGSAPPRRLTSTKAAESGAVFSPDSTRLAFSTHREGDEVDQIYVLPLNGGEALRMTSISTGASQPKWRPDGKAILFESRVYPGAMDDEANKKIAAERKARKYNARVYSGFPFRFWDRWLDDLNPHVFVQVLQEGAASKDLMAGSKLAALPGFDGVRSFGDAELEAEWTPDGASVVFTAIADKDVSAYGPITSHIYRVPATGGEPVALTSGPESYTKPTFRPDGKALYTLQTKRGDEDLYTLSRLAKIDWPPSGAAKPKLIADGWDRSISSFTLTPDSSRIYVIAEDQGHDKIFVLSAGGGPVHPAFDVTEGVYSGLNISERAGSPRLIALWGSMVHPEDVVLVDPQNGSRRFLTEFNKDRIEQIDWQPPKEFWFTAKNGKRVQSMLVLPPAFDPSKKYPLVVFPHGGPHNMTKDQFFVRWNYHLLTSPGYVLLMTNYTGSTGYGEEFSTAIDKDVLRGPAAEIEEAADEATRQFPFIDATRQAGVGASYGGYLMNWFEGNTKRFKCLVNHAGLTDNASMWGSTDGAYYWEKRYGGPVWELKGQWREQSPAAYAANFRTPMLITHGERDFRVPISQAFEMYKLLQRQRVPARLVIFPDHGHWILKGEDARYHMKEVLDWLNKYL